MSLDVNWEAIVRELLVPETCSGWLTERINQLLPKDAPLANVRVTEFDLCSCSAPTVELVNVTDVRDEFLLAAGRSRDINSPPPMTAGIADHSTRVAIDSASLLFARPSGNLLQDGVEVTVALSFNEDRLRVTLEADVVLNVPVPGFLALPVKFVLTRLQLTVQLVAALVGDALFVALTRAPTELDLQLAVDIGDPANHVLRNVAKIERFLMEQSRQALAERLTLPHFVQIPLSHLNSQGADGDGDVDVDGEVDFSCHENHDSCHEDHGSFRDSGHGSRDGHDSRHSNDYCVNQDGALSHRNEDGEGCISCRH